MSRPHCGILKVNLSGICSMDETTLLNQAHHLDPHALAELHDRHFQAVYRYILFRVGDVQLSEDLSSDVFLALLDALKGGKLRSPNIRAWLLATANHRVQDEYRKRYQRPQDNLDDHDQLPDGQDLEDSTDNAHNRLRVRSAMQRLSKDQQHVLTLRFSQELNLEETARALGRTVSAVKVIQFRAVQALRKLLLEESEPQ